MTLPPGTLVVDMAQPLARLAFLLLEPRSDADGGIVVAVPRLELFEVIRIFGNGSIEER